MVIIIGTVVVITHLSDSCCLSANYDVTPYMALKIIYYDTNVIVQ